ncbi:MAG: hypothetical protein MRJ68_18750 [Nitrospira sp.]|nr:hypothetical protein [Nitrospira sp.]
MMSSFSMLMLALSRELESQLNPGGEKEDGACETAGVPEGPVCTGSTVTEPLLLWRGLCGPDG